MAYSAEVHGDPTPDANEAYIAVQRRLLEELLHRFASVKEETDVIVWYNENLASKVEEFLLNNEANKALLSSTQTEQIYKVLLEYVDTLIQSGEVPPCYEDGEVVTLH